LAGSKSKRSEVAVNTQTAAKPLVVISNPHFAKGYRLGRIWFFHGEAELPVDDRYLIVNIANYCENGLHNDIEWLSERVGFLMGMVSGMWIPES